MAPCAARPSKSRDPARASGRCIHFTSARKARPPTTGSASFSTPDLGWHGHRGTVTALAASSDDTLKLVTALPEPGVSGRRDRLAFPLYLLANWLHFARDASGRDTALLHSSPWRSVEVWPAP